MKNSAVAEMLAKQYNWDKDDFSVEFTEFYQGEWNFLISHLSGVKLKLAIRQLDLTPYKLGD